MTIRKGSSYKDRPAQKKTVSSRAFEHALDFELMILERMNDMGMKKSDLANAMGVSRSGLSNFLNSQPNMTLETMTRFEIALDAVLSFSLIPAEEYEFTIDITGTDPGDQQCQSDNWNVQSGEDADRRFDKPVVYCINFQQPKDPLTNCNNATSDKVIIDKKEHIAA